MTLIRKYRTLIIVASLLAMWGYFFAVITLNPSQIAWARTAAFPFILAGIVALATFFTE